MNCDFCNRVITHGSFELIGADKLKAIVKKGFKFSDLNLPYDNQVYANLRSQGISIEEYDRYWRSNLVKDDTDWAACYECHPKIIQSEDKKDTESIHFFILTTSQVKNENRYLQSNIEDYGHELLNIFVIKDIKEIEFSKKFIDKALEPFFKMAKIDSKKLVKECHYTLDSDFNDLLLVRAYNKDKIKKNQLPQKLVWSKLTDVSKLADQPINHIKIVSETLDEAEKSLSKKIPKGYDLQTKKVIQEPIQKEEKVFGKNIEALSKLPSIDRPYIIKQQAISGEAQSISIDANLKMK